MKYFTRHLYEANQEESREAEEQWRVAGEAYLNSLKANRHLLPPSMQSFCEVTLHDGIIRSTARGPSTVSLHIDATHNPWGPRGHFDLVFHDVQEVFGLDDVLGDWWLYEEVHPHPAGFDYRVLLARSEFRIVAAFVSLKPA